MIEKLGNLSYLLTLMEFFYLYTWVMCGYNVGMEVVKMVKRGDVKTGARLPSELNEKVEEYARKIGVSKNAIILMALHKYLKPV